MRKLVLILVLLATGLIAAAVEPDILVTQTGESLKVYNLEVAANSVYYTLSEASDAPVERIAKGDVLIIKRADGTVLNLNEAGVPAVAAAAPATEAVKATVNPDAHEPVTYAAVSDFTTDKNGNKIVEVKDGKGEPIYFRLVPEEENTLAATVWQGKGRYEGEEYILPEYVTVGDVTYTVKYIDPKAFAAGTWIDTKHMKRVVFPSTLKAIGDKAFHARCALKTIILPEGLESVGEQAFYRCGVTADFEQIYIPVSVKSIGNNAFWYISKNRSPRGYYQGYLGCIPEFIGQNNCKTFGIDEEAVEAYEKRARR